MNSCLFAILCAALALVPGCSKRAPQHQYQLFLLGALDRTYVSVWLNGESVAGGFVSSDESIGLAFQMALDVPGDDGVLELRVNEDKGTAFKGVLPLNSRSGRYILAAVQKDQIIFETRNSAPTFE